jgi:hypothetical protein
MRTNKSQEPIFYVYIYLDPNSVGYSEYGNFAFIYKPFYVGKGHGLRCFDHVSKAKGLQKLHKHTPVIKKCWSLLHRDGMEPIIELLEIDLIESEAFDLEKQLISLIGRRDKGTGPLLNLCDGGEGISGKIYTEEERKERLESWTEEKRRLQSDRLKGTPTSPYQKKRTSETHKGNKEIAAKISEFRRNNPVILSEETRKKMSESAKKRQPISEETRKKMSESQKNRPVVTEETRKKLSLAQKGLKKGPFSEEAKKNMRRPKGGKLARGVPRKPLTLEHIEKIRESCKGKNTRPRTDEEKENLRLKALLQWERWRSTGFKRKKRRTKAEIENEKLLKCNGIG